jgi:CHC2 zinc finger
MARIPEEVIERVKREVSLVRLVELAGIELRRQGKDLVGCCPFHEDSNAVVGGLAGEELVALLGRLSGGWVGD